MNTLNLNELQVLVNNFKKEKEENKEENYIVKFNQQDGNINLTVYDGDKQIYQLPENYKPDKGNFRSELLCDNGHCTETWEYYIIKDSAPNNKIRILEEHDNQSDHFYVNATSCDGDKNVISGGYEVELSVRYNQAESEFVIYNIHNLVAV